MKSRWHKPDHPDDLKTHLAELDAETLRRDGQERAQRAEEEAERERQLQAAEALAKDELAKVIQRRRFGDAMMFIGMVFLILVAVLPANSNKPLLYLGAVIVVFSGAVQRDWAHRRIAKLLPQLSRAELAKQTRKE